jgi:DNA-binding MarR family transcriptional regulator
MEQNGMYKLPGIKKYFPKFDEFMPEQDAEFMMKFTETMLLLHRVVVVSDAYFQSMGTSKGRYLILTRLLLSDSPDGESISDLRPFYPISYAAMSGVLDTLEKDNMIERCTNLEDRRKVNIRLTDNGRTFIKAFLPSHVEKIKKIGFALDEDEIAQMFTSLKTIIKGFEQQTSPSPKN